MTLNPLLNKLDINNQINTYTHLLMKSTVVSLISKKYKKIVFCF